jgi:hypothetical protein
MVAERLGWRLLDKALLEEIGRRAKVSERSVEALDERVDPWLHRITRPLWGSGGDGYSTIVPVELFDADAEARMAQTVIQEAYSAGGCVVVGRGAQCVLRGRAGVFHVFVYADWADRVRRVRERVGPKKDVEALIRSMDAIRLDYIRRHHHLDRLNPHLYDLMVKSSQQLEAAARLILASMEMAV